MKKKLILTTVFVMLAITSVNASEVKNEREYSNKKYSMILKKNNIDSCIRFPNYNINQCTTQEHIETTTEVTTQITTEATTQKPINNNTNQNSMAQQVVELVNNERAKYGLAPLAIDSSVSEVAQAKSEDMRDNNYFSHTSPTYGSPFEMLKAFGVNYSSAGENIAKGQKTAQAVVEAWMNSEGHRENILNSNYTKIGVGYATGNGTTYWTQMFIK